MRSRTSLPGRVTSDSPLRRRRYATRTPLHARPSARDRASPGGARSSSSTRLRAVMSVTEPAQRIGVPEASREQRPVMWTQRVSPRGTIRMSTSTRSVLPAKCSATACAYFSAFAGIERESLDPFGPVGEGDVGRQPADVEQQRRDVHLVDRDIPVPVAVSGRLHRERVAMLGQTQRVFGRPAIRDVGNRARPARRLSGGVARDQAGQMNPPRFTARKNADLHVEAGRRTREVRRGRGLPLRAILRMQRKPGQEIGSS